MRSKLLIVKFNALLQLGSFTPTSIHAFTTYHIIPSSLKSAGSNTLHSFNTSRSKFHAKPIPSEETTTSLKSLVSSGDTAGTISDGNEFNGSTLTLLEHINLNVPNHDYILDFYFTILKMGVDPRRAQNIEKGSGTVWANCGASQFHLPYGDVGQCIDGSIGLVYDDLNGVVQRLQEFETKFSSNEDEKKPYHSFHIEQSDDGLVTCVHIVDRYDNMFQCRLRQGNTNVGDDDEIISTAKQPIVYSDKEEHIHEYNDVAQKYGFKQGEESECKGISYVEFNVVKGKDKIEDIAEFYDCVFDAPTSVISDPRDDRKIAIIGLGSIDETSGKASQSLLFREKYDNDDEIRKYDGHHIAFYVGQNKADFLKAFTNALEAAVVWVNPRFSDKVDNLNTAKKWKQFRFKSITNLEHGRKVFELEHEVRSIEHDSWPGVSKIE
jgi:hypothetical protein